MALRRALVVWTILAWKDQGGAAEVVASDCDVWELSACLEQVSGDDTCRAVDQRTRCLYSSGCMTAAHKEICEADHGQSCGARVCYAGMTQEHKEQYAYVAPARDSTAAHSWVCPTGMQYCSRWTDIASGKTCSRECRHPLWPLVPADFTGSVLAADKGLVLHDVKGDGAARASVVVLRGNRLSKDVGWHVMVRDADLSRVDGDAVRKLLMERRVASAALWVGVNGLRCEDGNCASLLHLDLMTNVRAELCGTAEGPKLAMYEVHRDGSLRRVGSCDYGVLSSMRPGVCSCGADLDGWGGVMVVLEEDDAGQADPGMTSEPTVEVRRRLTVDKGTWKGQRTNVLPASPKASTGKRRPAKKMSFVVFAILCFLLNAGFVVYIFWLL